MSLMYKPKNCWEVHADKKEEVFAFCDGYKSFLDQSKTEREAVKTAIALAEKNGFVPMDSKKELKPGDRVYFVNRGKNLLLAVIGQEDIEQGVKIVAAHIDSPRLDLKQNPLYEDLELGFLKTHYYGGIKKYQWTAIPLAIHGVVAKTDGSVVEICIGEEENDPVFCITDLLPHLATEQYSKPLKDAITGEGLNILTGSILFDEEKDKVKTGIMQLLYDKYGIEEEDFLSSEIEVVPAFNARDLGLDRSLVAAYGQDDRVCAYTALSAVFDCAKPNKTSICLLVDKEEIGSMGNTGAKSRFMECCLSELVRALKGNDKDYLLRSVLSNSSCLSADVGAGVDPNYKEVQELNNAPKLNYGVLVTKYTGARGKADSNDCHAEFVAQVRRIFNENGISWQIGELGKVDQGGGGTIAQYVSNLNVDTLDVGVPLLSMHSPFEVAAKMDIYMTYKGYAAYYNA